MMHSGYQVFSFKVWHSSAFQTMSIIWIYIKIINNGGSKLANLNEKCKQKQHASKKGTHLQKETIFTTDFFVLEKMFSRKCSNSSVFINSVSWNYVKYIFISRCDTLLTTLLKILGISGTELILKLFHKSRKINIVFKTERAYFYPHHKIYITVPNIFIT